MQLRQSHQRMRRKLGECKLSGEAEGQDGENDVDVANDNKNTFNSPVARVIMKLMYAARIARPDLLRTISFLSRYLTEWDQLSQKRLHRLMAYINNTTQYRMYAWSSRADDTMDVHLKVYSDSDYVGCPLTQRSTTGSMVCLVGEGFVMPVGLCQNGRGVSPGPRLRPSLLPWI